LGVAHEKFHSARRCRHGDPTDLRPLERRCVIGNLFGIYATDADLTEEVGLSLAGVLGQWRDRRRREGLVEHHGCQSQKRHGCRALPDRTAAKAAGTSYTTVRVRFDRVAVVAAGP
jgi:hypothetical protein